MKSLHVPFGFYPDVVGGTEVYVAALASALARQHHQAVVAAPGPAALSYLHDDGTPVHRFPVDEQVTDVAALYGEGDPSAAEGFARILDRERPDVVHLHAFTRACSLLLVRKARSRGIPVVFTYHTPTVSCVRGTLMLWGEAPCDGTLEISRCVACALQGHGVPRPLAEMLTFLPTDAVTPSADLQGRLWTALRLPALIRAQHTATRALFTEVDRIVAFRHWVRALLTANGVPDSKIVSSEHALCHPARLTYRKLRAIGSLRVAFMGRLDATKGVEVLIRALRVIPQTALTLDIYGAVQGSSGEQELARLRRTAERDKRVVFHPPVDAAAVIDTIAAHDVLAVPSQWMETGPLVVLEAFAGGVPVIASELGGITELVTDGVDGLLIRDFRSPQAWAACFKKLCHDARLLQKLRGHIKTPPGMDRAATEMIAMYQSVLDTKTVVSSTIGSVA